jgi:hypothetical protein
MTDTIFNPLGLNVIVDTKPAFCKLLTCAAKSKGIDLVAYSSPVAFQKDLHLFKDGTTFFFGQVFYNHSLSGTDLAQLVKTTLSCRVFLVTVLNRTDFHSSVSAGHIDLVLPKNMYLTEPFEETLMTIGDRNYVERELAISFLRSLDSEELSKTRKFWLSWMRQVQPSRISIAIAEPKPVTINTAEKSVPNKQVLTTANKSVGRLRFLTNFLNLSRLRPTPV